MHGTPLRKLGRLAAYLLRHPLSVPFYVTRGPFGGRTPLQLQLPWFSLPSIEFLDRFVTPAMEVFEYGAGGSTLYFARRAGRVVSTENDPAWVERVERALASGGFGNAEVQYRPFDFHHAEGFEQSDYLHSIPQRLFDVIVIDSAEEDETMVRPACFRHAEARVRPGGIIVVDDAWRYPELRAVNHAKTWREFRGIGPCRPGVTSTDSYFY
ncbi:MAG: class I SAM-dependent methyltransferase [Chthoniobacteraceae bacterium]|nr:class I SAM-dependent methyltransferase [Chthoniobacteraceae bacterium]